MVSTEPVSYYTLNVMVSSNEKSSSGVPHDIYLIAKHDSQHNFVFVKEETKNESFDTLEANPEIIIKKDQLVSIHYINRDTDSKHDLNIDEFNIHTSDLWYFETETSTFVANEVGTFRYYCSLHPEMSGSLIVK